MKKIVIALFVLVAFTGTAFAAGPEKIDLKASNGNIAFTHKAHQDLLKDCKKCHEKGPGKIAEKNKDWAHKVCKGCHADMKKGPTGCKDCHKK